ncbi:snRNA-activating protein complex subunit 2 [Patagioenas fasciata]|uniref:snRNA-activating protein complex subunit 2 n=1 Tax=Patagioenas fasciata TaxID=372321 RepID=UPI003A98E9E9
MKPPRRARLAPARFLPGPAAAEAEEEAEEEAEAGWSGREKRALLAALRAEAAGGAPELRAGALRERLPRRSERQILGFVSRLRGRAAREALSAQIRRGGRRPAPIEVWLELAQTLGGALEGATAAAFSQVLTVAATEPLNLLRSIPPQHGNEGTPPHGKEGTPPPGKLGPPPLSVSIPRLYQHLALLNRGGTGPPLPPGESAVLLSLLGALPRQLGALDVPALSGHFRQNWGVLSAPRAPPDTPLANGDPPAPQDPPPGGWRGVGICPLNLFLVPLGLLERGGGREAGE